MPHVVLLGDSIFDNASYVPGSPDVVKQLQARLPRDWRATLLAVDGHVVADVSAQFTGLPADATHLAVSVGGNDALGYSGVLFESVRSVSEAVSHLATIRDSFRSKYRKMLAEVVSRNLPTIVCTIYDAIPGLAPEAAAALTLFNDVIVSEATRAGVSVLELRLVCTDAADYSPLSPIEPSSRGGEKIATALAQALSSDAVNQGRTVVFGR